MTSHATCSHAATSKARAKCRAARRDPATVQAKADYAALVARPISNAVNVDHDAALVKTMARTAALGIDIPHTNAVKPEHMSDADWHVLLRNNARFTRSPFPTDEERAASLDKIWCTTCHLLHDLPACSGNVTRRAPAAPVEPTLEPRPQMMGRDMLPTFANARELAASIPGGRYAVRNASGQFEFYKLDKPTEGRWAGYTFLKVQASDEFHPIKSAARMISVFGGIIDAGVKESSTAYGHQLGSCGVCGRTLTDAESIAAGIGPKCASRMGW